MFGPPGRAYVYLVYGMHDCLNLVTEPDGEPAALLVRAIEPIEGVELMRTDRITRSIVRRRGLTDRRAAAATADRISRLPRERVASGPGSVTAAFGIDTSWTGMDLCDPASPLRLEPPSDEEAPVVGTTPRIGIDYAGAPWVKRPWRYVELGHPSVSRPVSGPVSRPLSGR